MGGKLDSRNLLVFLAVTAVNSLPIYNGFSVKFTPTVNKEEKPKTFGALFAKIPQELPRHEQEALSQAIFSNVGLLGSGCSNQIARILHSPKTVENDANNGTSWTKFINIPIIKQPIDDYKILIAAAPPSVYIDKTDNKPLLVYIVFPNDDKHDNFKIPSIYFVHEAKGHIDVHRKKLDPVIIVDHNRTVTKLKSKEIAKFVKFRSKMMNHFNSKSNK
ncbi:unnamed protein product [Leptosia nina]|uniref:Uncharacterized protein n=1 Tax=Leptosia nina TaxID=320188 RepID=A0AAV1JZ31_9NEOP